MFSTPTKRLPPMVVVGLAAAVFGAGWWLGQQRVATPSPAPAAAPSDAPEDAGAVGSAGPEVRIHLDAGIDLLPDASLHLRPMPPLELPGPSQ